MNRGSHNSLKTKAGWDLPVRSRQHNPLPGGPGGCSIVQGDTTFIGTRSRDGRPALGGFPMGNSGEPRLCPRLAFRIVASMLMTREPKKVVRRLSGRFTLCGSEAGPGPRAIVCDLTSYSYKEFGITPIVRGLAPGAQCRPWSKADQQITTTIKLEGSALCAPR